MLDLGWLLLICFACVRCYIFAGDCLLLMFLFDIYLIVFVIEFYVG